MSGPDEAISQDVVVRALAQLPPRVRTAVALRLYDDLSVAGVAQEMGLGEGTVKKYLAVARERLAPLVGELTDDDLAVAVVERGRR